MGEGRVKPYCAGDPVNLVDLSPWICNPRVFEVRIYNPPHHFGSQTLILRNGGLQIHCDRRSIGELNYSKYHKYP